MAKNKALQALAEHPLTAKFVKSLQHSDLPAGWQASPEIVDMAARAYSEAGTNSPFFKAWERAVGAPAVQAYHGTVDPSFDSFTKDLTFFTPDKNMASSYATGVGNPAVYPAYMSLPNAKEMDARGAVWNKLLLSDDMIRSFPESPTGHAVLYPKTDWFPLQDAVESLGGLGYTTKKNPYGEFTWIHANKTGRDAPLTTNLFANEAKDEGHSSAIIRNVRDIGHEAYEGSKGDVLISFSPEQIKSQFNRGTFDPSDPNIMRSIAPYAAGAGLAGGLLSTPEDVWASYNEPPRDAIEESWNPVEALAGGLGGGVASAFAGVPMDLAANIGMDKLGGLLSAPGGNATDYGNIRSWR